MTAEAEFLGRYDMYDHDHEAAKWPLFAWARQNCPVAHTSAEGGSQYILTRYSDVRYVLEHPETFSSKGVAPRAAPVVLNPLDADPPYQLDLRKILNPLFSRTYLMQFEPQMRAAAAAFIDGWIDQGRVDLIKQFAGPFVSSVLAAIVFNEPDLAKMEHASNLVKRTAEESTPESFIELATLASEYLIDREQNPVDRDDVLNAITTGTVLDGQRLTREQRLGVVTVLLMGGLDTTRGAIGSIAYHLATNPQLEDRLRDPKWIRNDLDEFIRLESPVGCLGRQVMADVEIGGVPIKAGEQVLLRFDSANRDEERFDHPDQLVFDGLRGGNAGFGLGIHRCLGAHLARIQIAVAFDELLKRATKFRLAGSGDDVHWMAGIANGPENLDLLFDVV